MRASPHSVKNVSLNVTSAYTVERAHSVCYVVYDLKGSFPSRRVYEDVKHMIAIVSFSLSSCFLIFCYVLNKTPFFNCFVCRQWLENSFTASLSDSNSEYGKNKPKLLLYIVKLCNFHNHQSSSFLAKIWSWKSWRKNKIINLWAFQREIACFSLSLRCIHLKEESLCKTVMFIRPVPGM